MAEVKLGEKDLTIDKVYSVAKNYTKITFSPQVRSRIKKCREVLEDLVDQNVLIYGVTTGVGEFANVKIPKEDSENLQKRIIYSHAVGVGDFFDESEVRAAMLLRSNVIAKGYSGVRLCIFETLIKMLNKNVVPAVNEKGSVGTSGDLSPLAQIAEVIIGKGRAFYQNKLRSGGEALKLAGIKPMKLSYKEALGLINGSQMFTACGALRIYDSCKLIKMSQIASSMTLEALNSSSLAFDERIHLLRPFNGQMVVARNIRRLLEIQNSKILNLVSKVRYQSQKDKENSSLDSARKIQDAYSMRCIPQIIGPTVDAIRYVKEQIEIEINSVTDNPLVLSDEKKVLSCGNFHGQPIALVLDLAAIAMNEIGILSERHINRLVNPHLSGLPPFLAEKGGLNSGFMIAHYTAAALASENKLLSHPAIVDNFSLSADQEDDVCMGPISAKKLKEILKNLTNILAIEILCASQGLDFQKGKKLSKGVRTAYEVVRSYVSHFADDRVLYPDIKIIADKIDSGEIVSAVEKEIGTLEMEVSKPSKINGKIKKFSL